MDIIITYKFVTIFDTNDKKKRMHKAEVRLTECPLLQSRVSVDLTH